MTIWKKITDWPYSVSDDGEVMNDRTRKVLTPMRMGQKRKQYSVVTLCNQGVDMRFKVHILVLTMFKGPRPAGHLGLHADDDTMNNRLSNLSWGTHKQNSLDIRAHGRGGCQKLTEAQAAEIKKRRLAGEKGAALAREFGVSQQTVCDIKAGRGWS